VRPGAGVLHHDCGQLWSGFVTRTLVSLSEDLLIMAQAVLHRRGQRRSHIAGIVAMEVTYQTTQILSLCGKASRKVASARWFAHPGARFLSCCRDLRVRKPLSTLVKNTFDTVT